MVPRRINVRVRLSGDALRTRPTTLKTARPQVRSEEIDACTHVDRQIDRQIHRITVLFSSTIVNDSHFRQTGYIE
jgi:hypothetical protein